MAINTGTGLPPQPVPLIGSGSTTSLVWYQFFVLLWQRTGAGTGQDINVIAAEAAAAVAASSAAVATANAAVATANAALVQAVASLKKAANLSDLASASAARTNLGLGPLAVAATRTGWAAPTGSVSRATFNANQSTLASAGYVQAEAQAVNDQLVIVQKRVAALIDDLTTSNVIGP